MTWSTAAVPPSRQFGYWREMICEAFLDLSPEAARCAGQLPRPGHAASPGAAWTSPGSSSQAQRVRRTEADIARSPQSGYYANLQLRGSCADHQDGRVAVTQPGDLT